MRSTANEHRAPWFWFEDLWSDLRFARRSLFRQKSFAVTAILTLALGIGANTALFSVVSGVVLRPLPFPEAERLVQLYGTSPLVPQRDAVSNFDEYRRQSHSFEELVGYDISARYLSRSGGSRRVMAVRAEREFFSMLGVAPLIGRTFRADDPPDVAVIGEGFWRQVLGGDPAVLGTTLTLDDQAFAVIGIMPEAFQFPYGAASVLPGVGSETRTDLWLPFDPPPSNARIGTVTGRLKAGVSLTTAANELTLIAKRVDAQAPAANKGRSVYLVPLSEAVVGTAVRRPLYLLLGAVAIVLALACANVMNLSLVRMTLRSQEVAVRSAIGASPSRLVRQFLTEGIVLSVAGGLGGLALGSWGTQQLMRQVRTQIPRAQEVGLDWRVFLFLLAACAVTAAAAGLLPAIFAVRADARAALQDSGGRATMSAGQRRIRDGLVIAEIALAFILAVGAVVLVRELTRLRQTNTGMATANVLTFHLGSRIATWSDTQRFYDIADKVGRLPGVRAAGFTQMLPLQNWGWTSNSRGFVIGGRGPLDTPAFPIEMRYVTPGYFQALGIPVRGRTFTEQDGPDRPRVILVNEALARKSFGDTDPIGMTTGRGTIVGVVGDVRQVQIDRPAQPELYFPMAQNWSQLSELGMSLVVSAQAANTGLTDAVRSVIREVDPGLAVFGVKTMDAVVAESLSDFTLFLWLMTLFAALALLLATTGTYGVMSYVAASRIREFAIRLALGADRTQVTGLILGQGMRLTAIGLTVGVCGSIAAAPLLDNLPVTVGPPGIMLTVGVALFIGAVGTTACFVPARRAGGIAPMPLLRDQ